MSPSYPRAQTLMVALFKAPQEFGQDSQQTGRVEITSDIAAGLLVFTVYDVNNQLIGTQGLATEGSMILFLKGMLEDM